MKSVKLNKISEKEMNDLKGGVLKSPGREGLPYYVSCPDGENFYSNCCGCGCYYANSGGSSVANNRSYNKVG